MRKILFNDSFFEIIDSEEKAYWLGFLAADGCISKRNRSNDRLTFTLSLAEKDYDHLLKFKEILNLNILPTQNVHRPKSIKFKKSEYISYSYRLHSTKFCQDLINKGVTQRKSLTLEPPKNVPDALVRHWIRGYFDGDGSVFLDKREHLRVSIAGTKEVLEFINLFGNLNKNLRKRCNFFSLRVSSNKAYKLLHQLFNESNIFLERKYSVWN